MGKMKPFVGIGLPLRTPPLSEEEFRRYEDFIETLIAKALTLNLPEDVPMPFIVCELKFGADGPEQIPVYRSEPRYGYPDCQYKPS